MNSAALTNEILQRLGWVLTHTFWEFGLLALIIAFARGLFRGAASRYIVASAGGALFLVATAVTLALVMRQPLPPNLLDPSLHLTPAIAGDTAVPYAAPTAPDAAPPFAPAPLPLTTRLRAVFDSLLPILPALYLAGLVAFSLRLLISYRHSRRLIATAHPASPQLHARVVDLARRVGVPRALRLLESAAVEVPCIVGGFRPVILVPVSTLAKLAAAQLDALLAHELAHLRRWDDIANFLQCALETLFFYHPATWWLSAQVRQDREHCCDDIAAAVCGDRVLYVSALTTLEELRTLTRLMPAARGGQLLQRIRRLLDVQDAPSRRLPASVGIAVALAIIGITFASIHIAHAQQTFRLSAATAPASQPANGQLPSNITLTFRPENGGRLLMLQDGKNDIGSSESLTLHLVAGPDGMILKSVESPNLREPAAESSSSGATLSAPPATKLNEEPIVYIIGPVAHPGAYNLSPNHKALTMKQMIAMAGLDMGDLTGVSVMLTRRGADGKEEHKEFPLLAIFTGELADPPLQANDVLWLKTDGRKSAEAANASSDSLMTELLKKRSALQVDLDTNRSLYGDNFKSNQTIKAQLESLDKQIDELKYEAQKKRNP